MLANVQPGVMRNQIEDIVKKMNAMLEHTHGNFPNDSEDEGLDKEHEELGKMNQPTS